MEVSILDILKSNFSKVCSGPVLLLFVAIVSLLADNSIGSNGGGFTTSFGADSTFYTQKKKLYQVRN